MTAWIILAFAFGLGMGFAFGILFTLYWQKRPLQNPFEPLEQQAKRSGWPEDEETDEARSLTRRKSVVLWIIRW